MPCSRPSSPPRWARAASCWSRRRPGRASRSSPRARSPAPCGARTTCGSRVARRDPGPGRLAGGGAWGHVPAPDASPHRRAAGIETTSGTVARRGLRRLPRRRPPHPVPRAHRRLRPHPLQAPHAPHRRPAAGLAPARGGDDGPQPGPLPRLCRAAGGRSTAPPARGRAGRVAGQRRPPDRRAVRPTARSSSATSHHYEPTPDPFAPEAVDRLITRRVSGRPRPAAPEIAERWTGIYSSAADR